MNLRRKSQALLLFLFVVGIAVFAANPYISFGLPGDPGYKVGGFLNARANLEVIVPAGTNILRDATILKRTGGGMLVAVAEPSAELLGKKLHLTYASTEADGMRFRAVTSGENAHLDLFDWEGIPLAQFVSSGHHGAINATLRGDRSDIQLDKAFNDRLIGLRFIQADLLLQGEITSQKYLPRDRSGVILGPGENSLLGMPEKVESAMRSLEPMLSDVRRFQTRYKVLTDADRKFVFSINGHRLIIRGAPHFVAWNPDESGRYVVSREELTEVLGQAWPLLIQANPLVMRSVIRAFRTASLFRYQQRENPEDWAALLRAVKDINIPIVQTPSYLVSGSPGGPN